MASSWSTLAACLDAALVLLLANYTGYDETVLEAIQIARTTGDPHP